MVLVSPGYLGGGAVYEFQRSGTPVGSVVPNSGGYEWAVGDLTGAGHIRVFGTNDMDIGAWE